MIFSSSNNLVHETISRRSIFLLAVLCQPSKSFRLGRFWNLCVLNYECSTCHILRSQVHPAICFLKRLYCQCIYLSAVHSPLWTSGSLVREWNPGLEIWFRRSDALLQILEEQDLNPEHPCKKPGMILGVPLIPMLWKQRGRWCGHVSGSPVPVSVRDSASRE